MTGSSPPSLTYLITGLQYGGANIGMVRLLSGLDPDAYDVTVVSVVETSEDVVDMLPEHVTLHQLDVSGPTELYRIPKLASLLRGTDVLVCSLFHASVVGVPIGKLVGVPRIMVWQHNTSYKAPRRRALYRYLYRLSDHVLADSEAVSTMLTEEFDLDPSNVSQLPIAGVDTQRFAPATRRDRDHQHVRVGTIARLVEQKGLFDLLECAERLDSQIHFEVIGQGEQREALEQAAPDNVTFVGAVDNDQLPERLAEYDIYFQPSKSEGLCMTVIEAMACGLPVVASAVGGITESVVPEETGLLCEAGDVECFCDGLGRLAGERKLRERMGAAGRQRVVSAYSQSVLAEQFTTAVERTKTV